MKGKLNTTGGLRAVIRVASTPTVLPPSDCLQVLSVIISTGFNVAHLASDVDRCSY